VGGKQPCENGNPLPVEPVKPPTEEKPEPPTEEKPEPPTEEKPEPPTEEKPEPPTEEKPEPPTEDKICKAEGVQPDPNGDCSKFYICQKVGSSWKVYTQNCPPGTAFDASIMGCNHASQVQGCSNKRRMNKVFLGHYKTCQ